MQADAVMLTAFGSAIAVFVVMCCLCNIISNKKMNQTKRPVAMRNFTAPPVPRGDVEKGTRSKDGGMVILAGAGAAVATAAVVASVNGGCGGGGCGGCGGGGCGGCGGGGCGGGCGG